jgi:hypothetical protein
MHGTWHGAAPTKVMPLPKTPARGSFSTHLPTTSEKANHQHSFDLRMVCMALETAPKEKKQDHNEDII